MWQQSVQAVIQDPKIQRVAVLTLSFAAGAATGYFLSKRQLEKSYNSLMEQEIAEARAFYKKQHKTDEYSDPSVLAEKYKDDEPVEVAPEVEMVAAAIEIAEEQDYVSYDKVALKQDETEVVEVTESIRKNIFVEQSSEDKFDLDDELEKKRIGLPYIVEHDYFMENPDEYIQVSLTFYTDDEVMAEDDEAVRDWQKLIGSQNLMFGHGSKDEKVVYIANDQNGIMYEINRFDGSFTEVVLGLNTELEHSHKSRPRKFRLDDD